MREVSQQWLTSQGKFETEARILAMRLAKARLLASSATTDSMILRPPSLYTKKAMNFSRSMIDNSQELAIIKRKLWDQNSKFSHEIRTCEAADILYYFLKNSTYSHPSTQKSHDTISYSSSNQSQELVLVARKFET